jgi:hypothetical protein
MTLMTRLVKWSRISSADNPVHFVPAIALSNAPEGWGISFAVAARPRVRENRKHLKRHVVASSRKY